MALRRSGWVDPMTERPKVGSAAMIYRDHGYLVLGKRGKEPNKGKWVIPGGKIEHMESIDQAVIREVQEETGLEVVVDKRLGIFEIITPPEHSVFVLSLCHAVGG